MSTTTIVNGLLSPNHAPENSPVKSLLLEPALTTGAAVFWLFTLLFVAVALMSMKVWESTVALFSGRPVRANPLILRYGRAIPFDLQRHRGHARA